MKQNSNALRWAQVASGIAFAAIAAYFVYLDARNNWTYFGKINPEFAGITVASVALIAMLPWKGWFGALRAICLVLACWASAANYAGSIGTDINRNAEAAAKKATLTADATTARATLAKITETNSTDVLRDMVKTAENIAADADKMARDAIGEDGACLKVNRCRKAAEDLKTLRERFGQAEARDRAQAKITEADTASASIGTVHIDVMAKKIAGALGQANEDTALTIAVILAVMAIAITQGGIILGHHAIWMIYDGVTGILSDRKIKSAPKPKAKPKAKTKAHKITKAEALTSLLNHIEQRGGTLVSPKAEIAKLFSGVNRNTVLGPRGWLAQWVRDGKLLAETRDESHTTIWRKAA